MKRLIGPMLAAVAACSPLSAEPPVVKPRIVAEHPHDPSAYTEGLFVRNGELWESTGREGSSDVRRTDIRTGRVIQRARLPEAAFGEGSVDWKDQIISLTWKTGRGYRWDARTMRLISTFSYAGEGWGLTRMGGMLAMSDGGADIVLRDPATFVESHRIHVTFNDKPLPYLNELEWIGGQIWANVWTTTLIARIDPATGCVSSWVDLSDIAARQPSRDRDAVANGIAWDEATGRIFVTGKNWTKVYEIAVDRSTFPEDMPRADSARPTS